jgi:hypothetical protein
MVYVQELKIAWKPLGLLLQQNHAKKSTWKSESNSDSNPNQVSQLNTELPPRDINHTFRIGNFLSRTFVCCNNNRMVACISEVAHYNIYNVPQDTLGTKTSKGLQWGQGQRSRIARDPHPRTVGDIPRGDLGHFVVEGIMCIYICTDIRTHVLL